MYLRALPNHLAVMAEQLGDWGDAAVAPYSSPGCREQSLHGGRAMQESVLLSEE